MDTPQQREALGAFIRSQRKMANLSLRRMADLAQISNPYLSQIERGMHEPSVRILRSIALVLNVSAETLLEQAGLLDSSGAESRHTEAVTGPDTEEVIEKDDHLTPQQREALLAVYRTYREANRS